MARYEFKKFIIAAKRNLSLRKRIKQCQQAEDVIYLAKELGFNIINKDLEEDHLLSDFNTWIHKSKISPIKKNI